VSAVARQHRSHPQLKDGLRNPVRPKILTVGRQIHTYTFTRLYNPVPPEPFCVGLAVSVSVSVAVNDIRASFMVRLVSSFTNERRRNASGARGNLCLLHWGKR
jgi:hypothetical protein